MLEFDDGNGVYDVVTRADYERWENEALLEEERIRRENATPEELADPYFDVPY